MQLPLLPLPAGILSDWVPIADANYVRPARRGDYMKIQCHVCGCVDDTEHATCNGAWVKYFDWSYAPERKGRALCSVCGPLRWADGMHTTFGRWHGKFERVYLPKGHFNTASNKRLMRTGGYVAHGIASKCNKMLESHHAIALQGASFAKVDGVVTVTLQDGRAGSLAHTGNCAIALVRLGVNSLQVIRVADSYEKLYRLKLARRIIDEAKPWHLLVVTE